MISSEQYYDELKEFIIKNLKSRDNKYNIVISKEFYDTTIKFTITNMYQDGSKTCVVLDDGKEVYITELDALDLEDLIKIANEINRTIS